MLDLSTIKMNEDDFAPLWMKKELERTLQEKHDFNCLDLLEAFQVKEWVEVGNPVSGTCRRCGHRGLVDDPCLGLY